MLGIVLAAGAATRLPNKPLLPMRGSGAPVIMSSISMLHRAGCNRIVVVISPFSVLPDVLSSGPSGDLMDKWGVEYITQREPLGVPHAIATAVEPFEETDQTRTVIVSMCDNVYPDSWVLPNLQSKMMSYAISQTNLSTAQLMHLARYNPGRGWTMTGPSRMAFAGPLVLTHATASSGRPGESTIEWLNRMEVEALPLTYGERMDWWFDIGTQEMYFQYWKADLDALAKRNSDHKQWPSIEQAIRPQAHLQKRSQALTETATDLDLKVG